VVVALPDSAGVAAVLHLPGDAPGEDRCSVVILCDDLFIKPPVEAGSRRFMDDLIAGLLACDLAVAMIDTARPPGAESWAGREAKLLSGAWHRELLHALVALNPDAAGRIGVLGRGLGALAAVSLATPASRLCLLSPASPSAAMELCRGMEREAELHEAIEAARAMEAIAQLTGPTLIVHGAADRGVKPEASLEYLEAIELGGRTVENLFIAWGDHEFSHPAARSACIAEVAAFMAALEAAGA